MKWLVGIVVLGTLLTIGVQTVEVKSVSAVETKQTLTVKKTDFGELEKEKMYWEKLVALKTSYRDAYLQLVAINLQMEKTDEARKWLKLALVVDPNFEVSPTLLELLQKE